jgi:predicted methyltransferase
MRKTMNLLLGLALIAAPAALGAAPANVAAAVSAPGRSEDNVKRDESRKPAELLKFFGLQQGMQVADMFGGNRYWAEILAPAVGPSGHVTVWEPTQFYDPDSKKAFEAFAAKTPNVSIISTAFEAPSLPPNTFDFMLINLDYHDVYWENAKYKVVKMDPDAWLKTAFAAMKPGGIVGVVDHVAKAGTPPRESVEKFHRIDPAVVKADFERAGFVLDGTSDMYKNPADDHSLLVFDKAIQGKTDRFIYRFRKPS